MFEVEIRNGASPSKYWAFVHFEDKAGAIHSRDVGGDRSATANSNFLQGLIEAFRLLKKPCMVTVRCESDYIVSCIQNGWLASWEKNGWKNAKGNEVRNAGQWKQLREAMAPHSVRFVYEKGVRG